MKSNKKSSKTLRGKFKETMRKFIVSLKKSPSMIPFTMLIISFLVFSLNLTDISNTTARIQGPGMGLCEFVSMLFSLLSMICLLNSFPKRQKPNYRMIALVFIFFALIIFSDVTYIGKITSSEIKITTNTMFIVTAQNVMIAHIILVAITAVTVALEPVFAKLLKKINTSVELEETNIANIDLVDEE